MSRRRISVKELGNVDCQGWLYRKKEARGFLGSKWKKYWFVLKKASLYWYTEPTAGKAEGYINLADFTTEQATECKRKHAMKASNPHVVTFYFAADGMKEMNKWLNKLNLVAKLKNRSEADTGEISGDGCYSEESDSEETADSPDAEQMALDDDSPTARSPSGPQCDSTEDCVSPADSTVTSGEPARSVPSPTVPATPQSSTPPPIELPQSWLHKVSQANQKLAEGTECPPLLLLQGDLRSGLRGDPDKGPERCSLSRVPAIVVRSADHSQAVSSTLLLPGTCAEDPQNVLCDEMERLYNNLKRSNLYPTGAYKPSTERDFKTSFIKRCKNEAMNEKLHLIRTLRSTLKAKEADLMIIEQVLGDACLSSKHYREWKEANMLLLQEISLQRRRVGGSDEQIASATSSATSCSENNV
ncbi:interactor protein for cytohesin exchange factors 1 isoform X1 [Scleropages formosus]|uniref:PH domain-containing protein n=1 Tax=Scleropages formosus TaxID=113540 RepID=A0A8C9R182_SCLFO|nr:interactor protein for cytohesin exchange factors 1 isoform X1 [Scleropages formosus]XP_018599217.1 interactor protein for cytohesin exchange factors 1 isoform X1 [Scleropages formosus]